jgi:hypothetical protein
MIGIHHWKSIPRKVKCSTKKSMSALPTERGGRPHQKIFFIYFLRKVFCEKSHCQPAILHRIWNAAHRRPAATSTAIGVGVGLAASPSHTTVRTGPYTAVRRIERTPVPAGGVSAGVWKRASARMLRSLQCGAVGLHLSALACRTDSTACLPHGTFERRVSTPHFQPFGPSPGRPAYYALC